MSTTPELALYDYWRSSAGYRVRIALNLKGLPYQRKPVHLVRDGGEQHAAAFHDVNPQELVPALVDGQRDLNYRRFPTLRGHYERLRLLSMLRFFLGAEGLRDLGLPSVPPLAVAPVIAGNVVKSTVINRTPAGRRFLERVGDRAARRELSLKFGAAEPTVGKLNV